MEWFLLGLLVVVVVLLVLAREARIFAPPIPPIPEEQDTLFGTTINAAKPRRCDHCGRACVNFEHRRSGIRCLEHHG